MLVTQTIGLVQTSDCNSVLLNSNANNMRYAIKKIKGIVFLAEAKMFYEVFKKGKCGQNESLDVFEIYITLVKYRETIVSALTSSDCVWERTVLERKGIVMIV